jgi:hypothetical protein
MLPCELKYLKKIKLEKNNLTELLRKEKDLK